MVIAHIDPTLNNGADEAAAVITAVHGEHRDGGWLVSLTAFPATLAAVMPVARARLVDVRPDGDDAAIGCCWWPPRV